MQDKNGKLGITVAAIAVVLALVANYAKSIYDPGDWFMLEWFGRKGSVLAS